MRVSHSKIETFVSCPYKYKLRYLDKLETFPNLDASNPLLIGTALHRGIETNVETALQEYFDNFPIINDQVIEEAIKLENVIEKCRWAIPDGGLHEIEVRYKNFIGYIDLLVPVGENEYDLYDFKYSNNVENYLKSGQLHEYKYFFEKANPSQKIRKLFFLFAPKCAIRLKKTETLEEFRRRIRDEIKNKLPIIKEVAYQPCKVAEFLRNYDACKSATEFEKKETKLCAWCDYEKFCQKGELTDMLPKNERKPSERLKYKKIWLYGLPFSGKTYLANKFDNVLMLNTDGNTKYVDAPKIEIKNIFEGRLKEPTKLAWDVFKEAIKDLETEPNDFETIVVDLLEDTYEACRVWCCKKMGITHESDNSFKGWDFVRSEFLNTIKRLVSLDYSIVFLSHEDDSKDITKKSGDKITAVKPNINDKVALKIAGLVDIVGRVVNDEGVRKISFKANEVIFGGGRLNLKKLEIPCEIEDLLACYGNATVKAVAPKKVAEPEEEIEVEEEVSALGDFSAEDVESEPTPEPIPRRRRAVAVETAEVEVVGETPEVAPRRRRRRSAEEE